ncbi:hypothetical protein HPP92_020846 [Vanilla planifolia]|uniref:Uncharacterized protein n=1 Tax=Vanilla planifolia TaxID=51239 RepID=A0A835UIV7_VANPL|nr:hypothetical protein HPP92_020846 [Vanilla planifolia]
MASLVLLLSELLRPKGARLAAIDRHLSYSFQSLRSGVSYGDRSTGTPAKGMLENDRWEADVNLQDMKVSIESVWP